VTTTEQTQQPNPTPANPGAADANAIRQQVLSEIFGDKFKDVDSAKQGYWNLNNYASQAYQHLEAEKSRLQPVTIDPFTQLESESLVKGDVLRKAIESVAQRIVNDKFGPIEQMAVARQNLSVKAPEYLANEAAILGWLQKTPSVAAEIATLEKAGLYEIAAKNALTEWQKANPPANPGNPALKQQAQLLGGTPQPGQRQPEGVQTPEDRAEFMKQAIAYGHVTGDRRPAYSNLFPNFKVEIPPHLAAQLNRQ
jgi:hypothetical protein